jgi:uncharacterized membrane protein
VTGLLLGVLLRSSGTLAFFYDPERAAIVTSMLVATPATMLLDDLVSQRASTALRGNWLSRVSLGVVTVYVAVLAVVATGLGTLLIGGQAPASLSANDGNVENFTVSTPEFATAEWIRSRVTHPNIVQADLHGQLVLLSRPGSYDLIPEIMPSEVDKGAYIYLSQVNLAERISQANADDGQYYTTYRSNIGFFDQHFSVVYSTGTTRVYH